MSRRLVVIQIGPGGLEVALLRGRSIARGPQRIQWDSGEWSTEWLPRLPDAAEALSNWVKANGAENLPCALAYHIPETRVVISAEDPTSARPVSAEGPDDLVTWRYPLRAVGGKPIQVVAHERDAHLSALRLMIEHAGLRTQAIVPQACAAVSATVVAASSLASTGNRVVLGIEPDASVVVCMRDGRAQLVRLLPLGFNDMALAIARRLRADGEQDPVLALQLAQHCLVRGFSGTKKVRRPAGLVPVLSPVLQRLAIESKQSARLGFSGDTPDDVAIAVCGVGAEVPGLLSRIAGFAEMDELIAQPAPRVWAPWRWLETGCLRGGLLPRDLSRERQGRRARRALWAGVGCAGCLLGADAAMTVSAIHAERDRIRVLEDQVAGAGEGMALRDRATAMEAAVWAARRDVAEFRARSPGWAAALAAVADTTPDDVAIASLEFSEREGQPTVELRGVVLGEGAGARSTLSAWATALTDQAVDRVEIGDTAIARSEGCPVLQFGLTLSLRSIPGRLLVRAHKDAQE